VIAAQRAPPRLEGRLQEALRGLVEAEPLVGRAQRPQHRGLDLGLLDELRLGPPGDRVEDRRDRDRAALDPRVGGAEHAEDEVVDPLGLRLLAPGHVALRLGEPGLAPRADEAGPDRHEEGQREDGGHAHQRAVTGHPAAQQLDRRVVLHAHELPRLEAPEVDGQLAGARVAVPGAKGHRLPDDGHQVARRGGRPRLEGRGRLGSRGGDRLGGAPARPGRAPGEEVVEDGPEGPDVGPLVHRLAPRLLGRHVLRSAHHRAHDGGAGARGGRSAVPLLVGAGAPEVLGEPPVHDHGLPERPDEDVGRLQVAVDDALAVGVGDRLRHRDEVGQEGEPRAERGALPEQRLQRPALDELHGVEGRPLRPEAGLVDGDDRRVLQPGGHEGLADEAWRALAGVLPQLLDRHHPPEAAVEGAQDAPHAPPRVLSRDGVVLAADDGKPRGPRLRGPLLDRGRAQRLEAERLGLGGPVRPRHRHGPHDTPGRQTPAGPSPCGPRAGQAALPDQLRRHEA
jgi:hypothetical protein